MIFMKIKKMKETEVDVEKYSYKDITIYFENTCFLEEDRSLAEKIAILLQREQHTGNPTYFLFDSDRLYSIDSTDDLFDILNDPEEWRCRYISKTEGIEVFLADEYEATDLAMKLCDPQNREKLCEEIIDEMLAEKNAVLTEDDTVITIG